MTLVHTQFFEKKYRSLLDGTAQEFQGQNFPYILLFQVNHVNSKEWISLKNLFHEINPSTHHHMIPKRFLIQILQPHVFPEKTHSLFSFLENSHLNLSQSFQKQGPHQGHTLFFFCQTIDEIQKFFENSEITSSSEPLMVSQTLWTKSQQKRFRPLGLFERSKTSNFSFVFWNSYDLQHILYLNSQKILPHQQVVTDILLPSSLQPLSSLHNFFSCQFFGGNFPHPFLHYHFELMNLLQSLLTKEMSKF